MPRKGIYSAKIISLLQHTHTYVFSARTDTLSRPLIGLLVLYIFLGLADAQAQTRPKPAVIRPVQSKTTITVPRPVLRPTLSKSNATTAITAPDSTAQADASFKTTVKYNARDSINVDNATQITELYGDASVEYGEISLKAEYIRLNYINSEVYAKGRFDSTAKKIIGLPVFKDAASQYDANEIRYNFKSKKGKIQGVVTQQGDGNIRGTNVKKDADDNLYIRKAIYTTCNLETPHYHINASKLKVIRNKQVVAGPFNLVINQIPLPIGLPFGFFPFPKQKDIGVSGVLVPQYGEEPNGRGYYLRDGGYYWAISENIGLQLTGQIYSRGSWGLGASSAYIKKYKYGGNVQLRFNRNRSSDRVDTTQGIRNDFSIAWSHSPQNLGKRSQFSANVNVTSNSYNIANSYSVQNAISNGASSSVQYSRTFGQFIRAGANIQVTQNFGQAVPGKAVRTGGQTNISTNFNFGVQQIAPFALRGGTGRWYESFRVGLDFNGSVAISNQLNPNRIDTTGLGFTVVAPGRTLTIINRTTSVKDSLARADSVRNGLLTATGVLPTSTLGLVAFNIENLPTILQNATKTGRYSIPISLPNFKLFRYINLTPGFSFSGDLYTKKLDYKYKPDQKAVQVDTLTGLFTNYSFAVNASMNTRLYGTFFFKGDRLKAIRHTIAPSVSFAYVPDFSNPSFGLFQQLPDELNLPEARRRVSRFRGLGGSSSAPGAQANISFGIVNQLEMKVRNRGDSTGNDFKKIAIFDNISLSGNYNLLALDGFNLSTINISANTQIFKTINFNFSSVFDPYAQINSPSASAPTTTNYIRVPVYAYSKGQGLARLQSAQFSVGGRFAPKKADKPKQAAGVSDEAINAINKNPDLYVDFTIPWSVNVNYSLSINRYTPELSSVIQTLQLTGDFSLTPKWKFTFQTGYDIQANRPSLTNIGINRDLHCWEMAFNWTPFAGSAQRVSNYSFDLRVKSALLQELKLSRRRSFYDRGGF
jgi:lipopolysaccharide assembly outer membrane protein LptD (OstA)